MQKWTDMVMPPETTIQASMENLVSSAGKIVLVVEHDRLLGTVTDGDIRRALLRRTSLDRPIAEIMNRTPRTVTPDVQESAVGALMRAHKIYQIPVVDAGGRLVGLHELETLLAGTQQDAWVVIMAGGLGSRLHPLTEDTPKPMLRVGGKPVIHTMVDSLVGHGFRRMFLSVKYRAEQIKSYFGNGENFGAQIEYIEEGEPRGTAGSLSLLPTKPAVPVLVINADLLTSVDYNQLLRFHRENLSAATMCVREYSIQVPYGVVDIMDNRVTGIVEKPTNAYFINAGIYILDPWCLDFIPKDERFDMTQLFEALLHQKQTISAFPIREYWLDIGRMQDLERAYNDYEVVFG